MQITTTESFSRNHLSAFRMALSETWQTRTDGEGVEKREYSSPDAGNTHWWETRWRILWGLLKQRKWEWGRTLSNPIHEINSKSLISKGQEGFYESLKENIGRTCDDINYKVFLSLDDVIARSFWITLIEQWEINPKPGNYDLHQFQRRCPKKWPYGMKEGNPECKEIFANQNTHKQFISRTNKQLTTW